MVNLELLQLEMHEWQSILCNLVCLLTFACVIANICVMARGFQILVLSCFIINLTGCNGPEKSEPLWEQVKVGDLAPSQDGEPLSAELLKTINFDIHIFEVPAENIGEFGDLWWMLYTRPLQFNSYDAFSANSFVVRFGQLQIWDRVHNFLVEAGGKKVTTISMLLSDGKANEVAVTRLSNRLVVSYISIDGLKQKTTIGPGTLALRVKAEKVPGSRGVCLVTASPVFSLPITDSIPQLATLAKSREFTFSSATFGLKMGPGDFIILGPEEYLGDQASLGGLFFSKPEGSLFFGEAERKRPERKPAVRILILVCTRIND